MNTLLPSAGRFARTPARWIGGVACLVLLAGCVAQAPLSTAAPGGSIPPTAPPSFTLSPPPIVSGSSQIVEVYAVPAARSTDDGALFSRTIVTGGTTAAASADVALGTGTDFLDNQAVTTDGTSAPVGQWRVSSSATTVVLRPGGPKLAVDAAAAKVAVPSLDTSDIPVPRSSLESGGVQYVQMGGVVVAARSGSLIGSYPLPTLAVDPTAGQAPAGYKGVYSGVGVGIVSALVPTTAGAVLAFSFTGRAAAVTNLMTGKTAPISGYSKLGPAARTASNKIMVLAWSALDETRAIQILVLDPDKLQITATIDTGLSAASFLRAVVLPGLGHDAVVAVAKGDEAAGVSLSVWTVDGAIIGRPAVLPVNCGLEVAPAGVSSVYVYNGPAKNTVGRLDLSSGSFAPDLPQLRAPAGSYVVGILPS